MKHAARSLVITLILTLNVFLNVQGRSLAGEIQTKDLVLIHGLGNHYRWGSSFLHALAKRIPGTSKIFVVTLNDDESIQELEMEGRKIFLVGQKRKRGGTKSIDEQASLLQKKTDALQERGLLSRPFDIAAHSMGGLVARRFAYLRPHSIRNLVTLGTPHTGSSLADRFSSLGKIMGMREAFSDLTPTTVEIFNQNFPVNETPLAVDGKIYTIAAHGALFYWGTWGELFSGNAYLRWIEGEKENDGLVPLGSAHIDGATRIADFTRMTHRGLVKNPNVAAIVSQILYPDLIKKIDFKDCQFYVDRLKK